MSAHTPDPWSLHQHSNGEDGQITDCSLTGGFVSKTFSIGAGEKLLGEVEAYKYADGSFSGGWLRISDFEECAANARLIAAAPQLLLALKNLKTLIEDEGVDFDCAYPEASAAIASAETPC